ncbi:MAG TPA: hypothetical protein VKU86_10465 [Acidimicrobiales bacterium]|nr:hypothetical protein [Acidimicrobiales bacterium]
MGYGIELVQGHLSDAASTGAQALTAGNQQSFTVRATAGGSAAVCLEAVIASFQAAGDLRIRSPRMHDDVNAVRLQATAGVPTVVAAEGFRQRLYSQDTPTVEAVFTTAPTAAEISIAGLLNYYDDVPGIAAVYKTWAELAPSIVDYLAVPVSPTSGATAGDWGTGVALNSTVDVFKANTLYALVGCIAQGAAAANGLWAIQGVDTGNLLVGGAINNSPTDQRRWFWWLEQVTGKPSIPVVNSQNKASTLAFAATQTASTAVELSLLFAQLSTAP